MKIGIRALQGLIVLLVAGCAGLTANSIMNTAMDVAQDPNKRAAVQQAAEAFGAAAQEITPRQEYYIGRAVAANILATRKAYDVQQATDYVNILGRSLSLYAERPDRTEPFAGFHFLIMDADEINAFAAPGGLILVSRGLLRCADGEETVAAILAHEISHVMLRHGLQAISNSRWTAALQAGVNAGVQVAGSPELRQLTGVFKDSVNDVTNTMVNSGYSREFEKQADLEAIRILRDAGYDPHALVKVLAVMKTKIKPGGQDFAKTHPDPDVRIAYLTDAIKAQTALPAATTAQMRARQARYLAALQNV